MRRYPDVFEGYSPDIFCSVFGIQTKVDSNDPACNGITKRKFGGMASYSLLSWLATTVRYDRVSPNVDDDTQTFSVISPALIFRTGWQARDQIALQYSHWFNGKNTNVAHARPPDARSPHDCPRQGRGIAQGQLLVVRRYTSCSAHFRPGAH